MPRYRRTLANSFIISLFAFHVAVFAADPCTPATLYRTLHNPNPGVAEYFGAVAISGDVLVIGAFGDDPLGLGPHPGAAYLYNAATGAPVATLLGTGYVDRDEFGVAVAASASIVAVGAESEDEAEATNVGAAYLFDAQTGASIARAGNPSPEDNEFFGEAIAIAGSLMVVGAEGNRVGGVAGVGAAYIFDATTGHLLRTLNNPEPSENDFFGSSVAIFGSVTVVGADGDDDGAFMGVGTAYVFDAESGDLVTVLHNPNGEGFSFGNSVAVSGDLAVVGAENTSSGGVSSFGRAYVFDVMSGLLVSTLNNPTPLEFEFFGTSVAISGNVALVGAYGDSPGSLAAAGSAYMFDATTGSLLATNIQPNRAAQDYFGLSVAISGNRAAVGAAGNDLGEGVNHRADAGSVYLFSCPIDGRPLGDFDNSGCTNIDDFLFLLDNWQLNNEGALVDVDDFLNLLDNWQLGPACP